MYQHLFFSFEGRISRSQYWLAWVAFFVANILVSIIGTSVLEGTAGGLLILAAWAAIGYSGLAVAAKRWHDRSKSGWWSLVALVPVVGFIWMMIENGFLPGTRGPNRFGPDPIKPTEVSYHGKTYYRRSDGSFLDSYGSPVRDAALIAGLSTAYVASRLEANLESSALDRLEDNGTSSSGWSWGSTDAASGGGAGD